MALTNRRFVLKERPSDIPGPEHFAIEQQPMPSLADGEILVRVLLAALSPWQGQRLKDFKNFTRPFEIGELIDCDVLGEVMQSSDPTIAAGQRVTGRLGWQEYAVARASSLTVVSDQFPDEHWLTALSSPGLTAYCAFDVCARPMPGQTLVVTSAAGAVGSYAIQLGKLAGMRVIGIAGGRSKCEFVTDTLGAHICLDHREDNLEQRLADACPEGVHLCFDTVGGPIADAVFESLAKYASVLIVGRTVSNNSATPAIDNVNMRQLWAREANVHCFSRYSHSDRFAFARERMSQLLANGLLKPVQNVVAGFENTPTALG